MKTCPDCGSRVYNLGCTWCNEEAYIEEQAAIDGSDPPRFESACCGWPVRNGLCTKCKENV